MKKIVSLLFICILLTGCGSNSSYTVIDANKAMEIINSEEVIIIDVREDDEYNRGHIEKAINVPVSDISSIDYDKETYIILYCASGVRSNQAAKKLSEMGYKKVYSLDGGLINWGFGLEE